MDEDGGDSDLPYSDEEDLEVDEDGEPEDSEEEEED